MRQEQLDQKSTDDGPPGLWQAMGSVVAAAFGVQSSKNRERDFKQGRFGNFMVAGVLFTMLLLAALYTVVQVVLGSN